ncbi:MAG: xanthine dehydrogenase accessory protein XdhC [Pirellulaceae bacterium]|nr:xanthine dehydrogenase accessory protein XdhC [Pirellulaceae bacterium]
MAFDLHEHLHKMNRLVAAGSAFVVVTMVEARGSAPQIQGAKAIVTRDGIVQGTLGGGKVEAKAIVHAQEILDRDDGICCELITWNLQTEIGMTCGGEVRFYFEVFNREDWKIVVFGAGHVAQSLVPILLRTSCTVTCIDQRQVWLDRLPSHPRLSKICTDDLKGQVKRLAAKSFVLLMTQGHSTDLPVLAEILANHHVPYLGVIGSQQKATVLKRNLKELAISAEKIESFFCPVGLPLGNNTPAEISISIMAQLIQERDRLRIVNHKTKAF